MTRRNRSSQVARRFSRAGRAFLRLDFGRAVSPSISTSIRPSGSPAFIVANSFGFPFASTLSCLARTSSSTRGRRRCTSNSSNMSASRSHTESTRVFAPISRAASAVALKPSSQRCVLRRFSFSFESVFTGSKPSASTPSGRPVALTASVVCMCRPRLVAVVWFFPMSCRPSQPGRREKFKSVPSWIARTVRWPRMRWMLRSRCGARMFPGVTSDSAGASIRR